MYKHVKPFVVALAIIVMLSVGVFIIGRASTASADSSPTPASRIVTSADGQNYMEVLDANGQYQPYYISGIQTVANNYPDFNNEMEKVQWLGFNTEIIQISWNMLQPNSPNDTPDFSVIDQRIAAANKYNTRLEIVWWGLNFCGRCDASADPHSNMEPAFLNDPKYIFSLPGSKNTYVYLPSDPVHGTDAQTAFNAENNVIQMLFAHLAQYDTTHRVIAIQLRNEMDTYPNFLTDPAVQNEWMQLTNVMGKVVKDSGDPMVTRLNYCDHATCSLAGCPYIDMAGYDAYTSQGSVVTKAFHDVPSAIPYIPEQGPGGTISAIGSLAYDTQASILAIANVNGGYVDFFSLSDSGFKYPDSGGGIFYPANDAWNTWPAPYPCASWVEGVKPTDANLVPGALNLVNYLHAMNKMGAVNATEPPSNKTGFNIATNSPYMNYTNWQQNNGYAIGFTTKDASIGACE